MKPDLPLSIRAGSSVLPVTLTESAGMSSVIPVHVPVSNPWLSEPLFPAVTKVKHTTSSFFFMYILPASLAVWA